MATAYTSLLGFALPVTGELSGTWGDTVNDSITKLVEDSIAGTATVSVTAGNVTLTTTGSGAANQARCAVIIATGTPGTARQIIAPSQSKAYIVINQSDSDVTFKGAATTGHTLKPGEANLLAWNGSDFMDIEQGDVAGPASATDNAVVRFDGTTGKLIQNSAVTIADTSGDIQTSGNIIVGDGTASLPSITNVGDTNTGIYFSGDNAVSVSTDGVQRTLIDSSGLTIQGQGDLRLADSDSSNWLAFQAPSTVSSNVTWTLPGADGTSGQVLSTNGSGTLSWSTSTIGTVTSVTGTGTVNGITLTGNVTSSGDLTLGGTLSGVDLTTQVTGTLPVGNGGTGITTGTSGGVPYFSATNTIASSGALTADNVVFGGGAGAAPSSSNLLTKSAAVTSGTYVKAIGYADTVTALGNTGTAKNIDVVSGGVFTATLTGNCTFTLRYPVSSGASSFTLILTNDGTAGRTVAWSGGSFVFPGGAASLSRTTAASAIDVWVFFTPNGGTTWYGNIAMKDMKA